MRKGDFTIHTLLSLVLFVIMLALVVYLIYSWSSDGSRTFWEYVNIPIG